MPRERQSMVDLSRRPGIRVLYAEVDGEGMHVIHAPAVKGHAPVRHAPGDWRCKCGVGLSGGPYGNGQRGARDVMRFHRLDLWMEKRTREA